MNHRTLVFEKEGTIWSFPEMQDQVSQNLMRAYAQFTPAGLPKDIDRENRRRFRRSMQNHTVETDAGAQPNAFVSLLDTVLASLRLGTSKA
jgi:hypothetical protein